MIRIGGFLGKGYLVVPCARVCAKNLPGTDSFNPQNSPVKEVLLYPLNNEVIETWRGKELAQEPITRLQWSLGVNPDSLAPLRRGRAVI